MKQTKQDNQELTAGSVGQQPEKQKRHEIVGKRGSRSKYFTDERGGVTAEFYGKPVHYYDGKQEQYREIVYRPTETHDCYELKENTFQTYFPKQTKDGKVFDMEKENCRVRLISKDAANQGGCKLDTCTCGEESCEECQMILHDVTESTDLEYVVDSERVKENIIIKGKRDNYEYNFELKLDNLTAELSEDGKSVELKRKDTGNAEFYIPSPYMTDAEGNRSESVYYEIGEQTAECLSIKVVADKEWLNAEGRAFPVTIDPQIVSTNYRGVYSYKDEGYLDSIFRYKTIENGKTVGSELRVYSDYANTGKMLNSELIILKSKISYGVIKNLTKAELKIKATKNSTGNFFSFNGENCVLAKDQPNEFSIDITELLQGHESELAVSLSNGSGKGSEEQKNIYFEAPKLEVQFQNEVIGLNVSKLPDIIEYKTGERFNPQGMVVIALYADGSYETVTDYKIAPEGGLRPDDNAVIIYLDRDKEVSTSCNIIVSGEGFIDRRPTVGMENVYIMHEVDQFGNKLDPTEKYVRLELHDGAEGQNVGTPLNAVNFNHMIAKAKNQE